MHSRMLAFAVALLWAGSAAGHDFWIQPSTFFPERDRPLALRLFVGDGFEKESERPFEKKATPKLQLISAKNTTDLLPLGKDNTLPFAEVKVSQAGHHWIAVEREKKSIRLEAAKFNAYLRSEGLDDILAQRQAAREDDRPGRECYSRYLKCLLRCGAGDDGWKKTCGLRLEIIPLADPYSVKVGDTLKVRVQFEGKPLANVPFFGLNRGGEKVAKQKLITNKDGVAEVKLSGKGVWLLRLVHMRRCSDATEADWESYWAALTFEVR